MTRTIKAERARRYLAALIVVANIKHEAELRRKVIPFPGTAPKTIA